MRLASHAKLLLPPAAFLLTLLMFSPAKSGSISTAGYLAADKYCELRELGYPDQRAWVEAVLSIERSSVWGPDVTADKNRSLLFGDKTRAAIRRKCPELLPRNIR